jgi:hypothetical protein
MAASTWASQTPSGHEASARAREIRAITVAATLAAFRPGTQHDQATAAAAIRRLGSYSARAAGVVGSKSGLMRR